MEVKWELSGGLGWELSGGYMVFRGYKVLRVLKGIAMVGVNEFKG